jgi:type I restriction enzyme R subunit
MNSEKDFEDYFIKMLVEENGYNYVDSGKLMMTERESSSDFILNNELETSLKRINKQIPERNLNDLIGKIKRSSSADLLTANRDSMNKLVNGVKVKDQILNQTLTYNLIDFDNLDNNSFIVTNQFRFKTNHPEFIDQVPDIVIFINGLPLIVIELKKPFQAHDDSIERAYTQIKNYQEYMSDLFTFNCFNIISNKFENKYGTLTSNLERYFNWFDLDNKDSVGFNEFEGFVKSLLNKKVVLNIIKNYLFFQNESKSKPVKIISGYHQYFGIENAITSMKNSVDNKVGIIWHTQGSGKSLSMVFLIKKTIELNPLTTFLIVTDRKELDDQIANTISKSSDFLGQYPHQFDSINDLRKTLNNHKQNGIFETTIQKFDNSIELLSDRKDILVIADEAHRSHNSNDEIEIRINEDGSKIIAENKEGNAKRLRKALPNAKFIGFTGTPIENNSRSTQEVFGKYISKYLMNDAINDGTIVPISYESRFVQIKYNEELLNQIDEITKNIYTKFEESTFLHAEAKMNFESKFNKLSLLVSNDERIEQIAIDFIDRYKNREKLLKGKAMFVAYDRKCAYKYYKKIIELEPNFKNKINLIMSINNESDPIEWQEVVPQGDKLKEAAIKFKNPDSDFKIAIVVDMWLTGFDVPSLDVMYIDKFLKMHNLMQAIARVNRVFKDETDSNLVKKAGLVVDYIGIFKNLEAAIDFYNGSGDQIKNSAIITDEDISSILKKIDAVEQDFFSKLAINWTFMMQRNIDVHHEMRLMLNELTKNEKVEEFYEETVDFRFSLSSFIGLMNEETIYKLSFYIVLRNEIHNREIGKLDYTCDIKLLTEKINQAISCYGDTIVSEEPVDLNSVIEFINLMTPQKETIFLDNQELEISCEMMLQKIRAISIYKYKKISEVIQDLIKGLNESVSDFTRIKEKIIECGREALDNNFKEKGFLDNVEYEFYQILADDKFASDKFNNEKLMEIVRQIRSEVSTIVSPRWEYDRGAQEKVKGIVKKVLLKNDFPESAYNDDSNNNLRAMIIEQITNVVENNNYKL